MTASSRTGNAGATSSAADHALLPRSKRVVDVAVSAALIVLLAPVWAAVVAAASVDMVRCPADRGRLLYRERRISRGRTFGLLKFRVLKEPALARAGGHSRPLESDPTNLTWLGRRVLKPMYLDELPQLVNVLRGEMSLVGPRPWPPELVERQVERGVRYRLRVAAGWTGLAQVSKGRENAEFEKLDLEYVELLRTNSGWALARRDLAILRQTVGTIIRREGLRY
jgi:lipopolysaccharide/colanic/teichoic acid biosynthesis glycosyltransferase